jgi:hypothetical protein
MKRRGAGSIVNDSAQMALAYMHRFGQAMDAYIIYHAGVYIIKYLR